MAQRTVTKETYVEQATTPVAATTVTTPVEEPVTTEAVGFKMYQIVYFLFGILEALLGLRFLFKLLGANPRSPFVDFMYDLTSPFVAPFSGIFGTPTAQGSVFETATLVAMIVYFLIALAIAELLRIASTKRGNF